MTEPVQPAKVDPETLVLRAQPRRVVRFKRNALIGAAAIGCVGIAAVTWLGLRTPDQTPAAQKELYDPDKGADIQKPKPERFQSLPKSYAEVPGGVPPLGPPLPGDLGRPILEHQQAQASMATTSQTGGVQSPVRQETGLFFQVSARTAETAPTPSAVTPETGASAALSKSGLTLSPDVDQNAQGRKLDFIEPKPTAGIYNGHALQTPISPYQLMAGTVIAASLITGVNSDLPGMVIAQVTEPVFDTVTGQILLVPQGTRLIGEYDSIIAFGQSRALLVWKRMVMPDGSSLEIDNLPASDTQGYAGLSDRIDYHTWSLIKGVGLSTLLGLAAQDSRSESDSDLVKALRESTQQTANQAGQKIVEKTLNVQPGLSIRPGWSLRVIVHKDLILKPYIK
jgi:type IV secretion system protein TrbI